MPRYKGHVVAVRPKLFRDTIKQVLMIAFRKVRATDRALKKHIANESNLVCFTQKDHMTRRVSRAVLDLQFRLANSNGFATLQPTGRHTVP